jgi:DNA-binding response OmpR family regulator
VRSPAIPPVNIKVVEVEPELASALVRGLEEVQFSVQLCGEGKTALQKSEAGNFDLVLLGVVLPDLSGFDVVEQNIASKLRHLRFQPLPRLLKISL